MSRKIIATNSVLSKNGIIRCTWHDILNLHDLFLFDVYGVLQRHSGPIPSAVEAFSSTLNHNKQVYIVSNTCNELPQNASQKYASWGLTFPAEKIFTSGMLLKDYFESNGLVGSHVLVLGNKPDAYEYIRRAGGIVFHGDEISDNTLIRGIVVTYEDYQPVSFRAALNLLINNPTLPVIVPNTDVLAPYAPGVVKPGAASVAISLVSILATEDIHVSPVMLGKPHLYRNALAQIIPGLAHEIPKERTLIIGDTLKYDVVAANNLGIKSLLVLSGSHQHLSDQALYDQMVRLNAFPDYWMPFLSPE